MRRPSLSVPIISCLFLSSFWVSLNTAALAQDAFGSGPGGGVDGFYSGDYAYGTQTSVTGVNSPTLEGETNGTIAPYNLEGLIRLPRDEYDKLVTLPAPRILLGAALTDLTTREIAAEEEVAPPDFPPLPRSISLPAGVTNQACHYPSREEFAVPGGLSDGWNMGGTAYSDRRAVLAGAAPVVSGTTDLFIEQSLLDYIMKVGEMCGNNEDYNCRLGALGLKMMYQYKLPELAFPMSGNEMDLEIRELKRALRFRENIAKIPAVTASCAARAKNAERLENCGKPFEALVERLRIVEISDDGPSRYYLARLYRRIGEKKLAFETLKEALEAKWKPRDRAILGQAHSLVGAILLDASHSASRINNRELHLLRLRNASIAFRRALIIDPQDAQAQDGLLRVAKEAVAADPSFDNYLCLAGANLLAGNTERAQIAYDECAEINAGDPRLRQARSIIKFAGRSGQASWGVATHISRK